MRPIVWGVSLSVLLCVPARAQQPLTEADAVARLSADSPRIRALRAGLAMAEADVLAARRLPNPSVTLSREAAGGVSEKYALVTQVVPITGRRQLETAAARLSASATALRIGDLERRAAAEVRLAFATLLAAQTRESEIASTHKSLQELVGAIRSREQAGDVAGFDRLRVEREVLDVEADLSEAGARLARAQADLAAYFDPAIAPSALRAAGPAPPRELPTAEQLIARAHETRGLLTALQHDIESAESARKAADRSRWPEPEVAGGVKTPGVSGLDAGSVLSISAALPLFDRSRAERARAEARGRQAAAELDWQRARIRAEILGLHAAVEAQRRVAAAYRADAITRSAALQRIARVSYDAGDRTLLELLDTFRVGLAARLRVADLDAELRRLEVDLEFVSGWEARR